MDNIVKFPYDACRRIHSRKQRRSKNGTPEERAAKAVAVARNSKPGSVIDLSGRSGDNRRPASVKASRQSLVEFLQCLKEALERGFAKGNDIDQIFDCLIEEASKIPEFVAPP
jgi:hypothetical protein